MAMTDEEILSVAGRLRAAKRRTVERTCEICGTRFEGIASRRYCSDRCRMRASRARQSETAAETIAVREDRRATIERLYQLRDEISGGRVLADDSTEMLEKTNMAVRSRRVDDARLETHDGEDPIDYLLRLRALVFGETTLDTRSVELLGESRDERTAQLDRMAGLDSHDARGHA